jgi:hypothetical protein
MESLNYPLVLVFTTLEQAEIALTQYESNMANEYNPNPSWDTIRQRIETDNKYFFQMDMDNLRYLKDMQNIFSIEEYSPTWLPQES